MLSKRASIYTSYVNPFNHWVIDEFWEPEIANKLYEEFPSSLDWTYRNDFEYKQTCNNWDKFGATTYQAFTYLLSPTFNTFIRDITGMREVYPDVGLHGGGLHYHPPEGKLNPHLDYANHPKLNKERKLNLIVYMTKGYKKSWGGNLGLWTEEEIEKHDYPAVQVEPLFNRAVIFETGDRSWHGVVDDIPNTCHRMSMAVYFLSKEASSTKRPRAFYALTHEDMKKDNREFLEEYRYERAGIVGRD